MVDIPTCSELLLHAFPFIHSSICPGIKDGSHDLGDKFADDHAANQQVILQGGVGLSSACRYGFMACHGSLPSCREENDSYPNRSDSGSKKAGMCYIVLGRYNQPSIFAPFFVVFVPDSFATNPSVIEMVTGSVSVEHPQ